MVYNPELVKNLLGEQVSELFDGTVIIEPATKQDQLLYANLKVGDSLTFTFKNKPDNEPRKFVISSK